MTDMLISLDFDISVETNFNLFHAVFAHLVTFVLNLATGLADSQVISLFLSLSLSV